MARLNVYVPDPLAQAAKDAGLNVSAVTQRALRAALDARRTDLWLDQVAAMGPTAVSHDGLLSAVGQAKDELGSRGG